MNIIASESHFNNGESFVISQYLDFLTVSEKDKSKYVCPVCEGHNFSIKKDGIIWNCFSDTSKQHRNEVAYKLRKLNGEFKEKKSDAFNDPLQVNKPDKSRKNQASKQTTETKKLTSNVDALDYIKELWGDNLRFNLRSLTIELDGQKLDADTIHTTLAEQHRVDISKERAIDVTYHLALKQQYDPVKDYFESIKDLKSSFTKDFISGFLFKVNDPYYNEMIWLFLVGVVKRVYEPGCKFDYAFVLQGEQDKGKSSFFRALLPGSFDDNMSSRLGVDDLRMMNSAAINEWAELGNFTAKQYEDVIKAFLSRQEDQFRLPYAKELLTYPRRSVIVGSVNEGQFLKDITGNRRFLVMPITWIIKPLDLDVIRNELWALVIQDYFENWEGKFHELILSDASKTRQKQENEGFRITDILEEAIADYLDGKEGIYLAMGEILNYLQDWKEGVLGIKGSDRGTQMRIGKIMNEAGWTKKAKWIANKTQKVWVHKSQK